MIQAEVRRNDKLLMTRTFYDPCLTLESVLKLMELYIVNEQLNTLGECLLRVRFSNLQKAS